MGGRYRVRSLPAKEHPWKYVQSVPYPTHPRAKTLRQSHHEHSPAPSLFLQYLLSMVVEYFGRVQLPGHLYNRIHFFLAL